MNENDRKLERGIVDGLQYLLGQCVKDMAASRRRDRLIKAHQAVEAERAEPMAT